MTLQQYMMFIYKWNPNRATIIIDARTKERVSWNDLPDNMNRIVLHIYPNESTITLYLGDKMEVEHEQVCRKNVG